MTSLAPFGQVLSFFSLSSLSTGLAYFLVWLRFYKVRVISAPLFGPFHLSVADLGFCFSCLPLTVFNQLTCNSKFLHLHKWISHRIVKVYGESHEVIPFLISFAPVFLTSCATPPRSRYKFLKPSFPWHLAELLIEPGAELLAGNVEILAEKSI